MIRAFLTAFTFGLLAIWGAHNYYQLQQSFKRCQVQVEQLHRYADYLETLKEF